MKRIAVYDVETGLVRSVVRGDAKSLKATIAALPKGQAHIAVPNGVDVRRCMVQDGEFVPAPPCPKRAEKKLRMERNARLERDCDPVLNNTLRRRSIGPAKVREWSAYRQALLDITKGDVFAPEWPKKPK